jgi:S-adenosylmethionine:tRNA ribosyltransferase-isomerase
VKAEEITDHHMHSEHYFLPAKTAELINRTKQNGGRVIAVGTTSCRTLESVAAFNNGIIGQKEGYTDIFIYPGYEFKVIDGLLTNFHLPESTLIMLVSAFLGYEKTMEAYAEAVKEKYRFFSFGDAMLIT